MTAAYFFFEWKRSWKLLKKLFVGLCLSVVVLLAVTAAAGYAMNRASLLEKVPLGILIPESENQTRQVVQFASTIDSVSSICEFSYYGDRQEMIDDLECGTLRACVIFPENFYEDADQGVNTPATVLVADAPGLSETLFQGMLGHGVELLQIGEAGVYATLDVADAYGASMSREEIGDLVLMLYVQQLLYGGRWFSTEVISPLGTLDLSQYLLGALLLLAVFLPGLCLGAFYDRRQRILEQKLRIGGLTPWKLSLIRVLVTGNFLWVCFAAVYVLGCLIGYFLERQVLFWSLEVLAGAGLLCLLLACVFHGIYGCCGVRTGTALALLFELLMVLGSGMVFPVDFLPEWFGKICGAFGLDRWPGYLLQLLYHGLDRSVLPGMAGAALFMFGLGVFGSWRHTWSGFRYS